MCSFVIRRFLTGNILVILSLQRNVLSKCCKTSFLTFILCIITKTCETYCLMWCLHGSESAHLVRLALFYEISPPCEIPCKSCFRLHEGRAENFPYKHTQKDWPSYNACELDPALRERSENSHIKARWNSALFIGLPLQRGLARLLINTPLISSETNTRTDVWIWALWYNLCIHTRSIYPAIGPQALALASAVLSSERFCKWEFSRREFVNSDWRSKFLGLVDKWNGVKDLHTYWGFRPEVLC